MDNFWKLIFDSLHPAYQWGAIDSNGDIWVFTFKPKVQIYNNATVGDYIAWDIKAGDIEPEHWGELDSHKVGNIPAIGDDAAKTSLVCRKDIDDKQP